MVYLPKTDHMFRCSCCSPHFPCVHPIIKAFSNQIIFLTSHYHIISPWFSLPGFFCHIFQPTMSHEVVRLHVRWSMISPSPKKQNLPPLFGSPSCPQGWDFIQHMPEHIGYLLRQSEERRDAEGDERATTARSARSGGSQRQLLWPAESEIGMV